ncbi:unnamed protein product [Agarophyton chilense]
MSSSSLSAAFYLSNGSIFLKSQISELVNRKSGRKLKKFIVDAQIEESLSVRPDPCEYSAAIALKYSSSDPIQLWISTEYVELENYSYGLRKTMAALLSTMKNFLGKGEMHLTSELVGVAQIVAACGRDAADEDSSFNTTIRMFQENKLLPSVFDVLHKMRMAEVEAGNESFDFLANAAARKDQFVEGAVSIETLPDPLGAEIAFVGRSNVGKTSIVDMICNR